MKIHFLGTGAADWNIEKDIDNPEYRRNSGILDYRIFEHNSLEMVELLCNTFKNNCSLFYISHMAKTLHRSHAELSEYMKSKGINVAYDNHIVEI